MKMATKEEIQEFLKQLNEKMIVFQIAFRSRDKNLDTIAKIEIAPNERVEYIRKLKPENYISGPNKDTYDTSKPDYYEFGIIINGNEVYIKISLGLPNKMIDCMSFHIAEFTMNYPLK
jgi:hypothetical protein